MLTYPCGLVYFRQTKLPLKQQISEHKAVICTGNMDYAIAKHCVEISSLKFWELRG